MNINSINRKLNKKFGGAVTAELTENCIVLKGELNDWNDVVDAGLTARIYMLSMISCTPARSPRKCTCRA